MHLPPSFRFEAWTIRYSLLESDSKDLFRDKRSVVLVHGTPWSSIVFLSLATHLLASEVPYRILIYDLPGYGHSQIYDSTAPDATFKAGFAGDTSVGFQARALVALLQHTNLSISSVPRPAVVAHDIAGAIVLRAHLVHGAEFSSMLLCSTNAVLPWGDGFYNLVRNEPQVFLDLPAHVFEAVVRAVVRSALYNRGDDAAGQGWEDKLLGPWVAAKGIFIAKQEGEAKEKQRAFVRQIAQTNDEDVREMLDRRLYRNVRCDVKIMLGAEDSWIPREKVEELRSRIGRRATEIVVVPGAGHLVMLDQPEVFEREVVEWLSHAEEIRLHPSESGDAT